MFSQPKIHTISKSAIVPYSRQQMFDLVNAIEDYPHFLSWCSNTRILAKEPRQTIASISIYKLGIGQTFTTINTLKTGRSIQVRLKNGPFKQLVGSWVFNTINKTGCKINFDIEFSFDNKLMDLAITPVFKHITNTQLESFIKQAHKLYA